MWGPGGIDPRAFGELSTIPAVFILPERGAAGPEDAPRTVTKETRHPARCLSVEPDFLEFLRVGGSSALVRGAPLDTGRITVRLAPPFGPLAERAFASGGFIEVAAPGQLRSSRYRLVGVSRDPAGGEVIVRAERFEA